MAKPIIPIFYACDDAFVKYTVVSLHSMMANADPNYQYHVHILHTEITPRVRRSFQKMEAENVKIFFEDVSSYLETLSSRLPIRDYYSKTTYFRLFIADMFPEYN